jgi:predicted ester cyclase
MSSEENVELIKKWINEGWNARNPALIDELFHPDFEVAGRPNKRVGLDGYKRYVNDILSAFLDWHLEIRECISEGDIVVITYQATGTHTGLGYSTHPPSGNCLDTVVVDVWRIMDGKIRERINAVFDDRAIAEQLGFDPSYLPADD